MPEALSRAAEANSRASRGNKIGKVAEWEQLPLQSSDDIQAWYSWKVSGSRADETSLSTEMDESTALKNLSTQQRAEPAETFSLSQTMSTIQNDPSRTPSANSATTTSGRAKDLSQSHGDLYF